MGVPPSCHVHLPMSPLWLRCRWQEQSGACQSNRKRLALSHAHRFPLSYSTNRQTHSLSTPLWVCQLSLTSQTSSVQGSFPFVPSHSQVTFTRGCMLGMPRLCAGNIGPDNLSRQRQENENEREVISVCMFIKHCIYIIGIYVCAHLFYFIFIV